MCETEVVNVLPPYKVKWVEQVLVMITLLTTNKITMIFLVLFRSFNII